MNVMDRSVVAAADQEAKQQAKLALARRQRRWKIAIGVALIVVIAAAGLLLLGHHTVRRLRRTAGAASHAAGLSA